MKYHQMLLELVDSLSLAEVFAAIIMITLLTFAVAGFMKAYNDFKRERIK